MIPQYEPQDMSRYANAVSAQIVSGWIGPGPKTEEFEKLIGKSLNVENVICTNSGTSALLLSALAIKRVLNSENKRLKVLFPAYTFLAGLNAYVMAGYDYELVDIDQRTMCMDIDLLEKKLKDTNVDVVIYVNHNGYNGPDIQKAKLICQKYKAIMVEDSAQCYGIPNTFITGDMSILSFSVPKAITTGQGGALIVNNPTFVSAARAIVDHGGDNWRKTKVHTSPGLNLRMSDINSCFGIEQIKDWAHISFERKRVWDQYNKYIEIRRVQHNWSWMVIYEARSKENADEIILELKKNDIQGIKYYRAVNENPCYSGGSFPVAKKMYENLVYLPSSIKLKNEEIENICKIIVENS